MDKDYTLQMPGTSVELFREPIPISVSLLNDGVAGEGLETITLTLIQILGVVDDRYYLQYKTAVIHLRDIDGKNIIFIIVVGHSLGRD